MDSLFWKQTSKCWDFLFVCFWAPSTPSLVNAAVGKKIWINGSLDHNCDESGLVTMQMAGLSQAQKTPLLHTQHHQDFSIFCFSLHYFEYSHFAFSHSISMCKCCLGSCLFSFWTKSDQCICHFIINISMAISDRCQCCSKFPVPWQQSDSTYYKITPNLLVAGT